MRTLYLAFIFSVSCASLYAQPPVNDECNSALYLANTTSWCSDPGEFSNLNATPFSGNEPANNCFLQYDNEVWFSFTPQTPAIYISVSGLVNNLGTLQNPGIGIFEGTCNN